MDLRIVENARLRRHVEELKVLLQLLAVDEGKMSTMSVQHKYWFQAGLIRFDCFHQMLFQVLVEATISHHKREGVPT